MRPVLAKAAPYYAAALVIGGIVGWLFGDHHLKAWLLSGAGAAEVVGVLLVAAPELEPFAGRAVAVLASARRQALALARRAAARVRQLLGRPKHHVVLVADAAGTSDAVGSISVRKSVSPTASLKEKVEYLLGRDRETQTRLEEIERLPAQWRRDVDEATAALRDEYTEALATLRDQRLMERLAGLVLLLIGVALNTAGNLV